MELIPLGRTHERIPILGLGTWKIGGGFFQPDYSKDEQTVEILKRAIELGYKLIDTAEMYGGGHAEELVGKAIKDFDREELFIISKVWPSNLEEGKILKSAKASVKRLGTYIDLYLIHAPNPKMEIGEQIKVLELVVREGLSRYIGVSNFSADEVREALEACKKEEIVLNQCELSVMHKHNVELLDFCRSLGITFQAYSPLAQGALMKARIFSELERIGSEYGKSGVQVALNWIFCKGACAVVKSTNLDHLLEDLGSVGWRLKREHVKIIDEW